jgi:hypothetical protein
LNISRRKLIVAASSTVVALAVGAPILTSLNEKALPDFKPLKFLSTEHQYLLLGLIPAFTGHFNLSQSSVLTTISDIDSSILILPQRSQDELLELLQLLSYRYSRWFTTGFWQHFEQQDMQHVGAEFSAWRRSGIQLFRQASSGLHELILGAFYANPNHWKLAKYEGPPV